MADVQAEKDAIFRARVRSILVDRASLDEYIEEFFDEVLDDIVEAHRGDIDESGRMAEVAAELYRDHDMPPNKDSRGYSYRMGWWDGVHHAAKLVERAAKEARRG